MLRLSNLYVLVAMLSLVLACSKTKDLTQQTKETSAAPTHSTMLATLPNCGDVPPVLHKFNGVGFEQLQYAERIGQDSFQIQLPTGEPTFYYLNAGGGAHRPVIFGDAGQFVLNGDCTQMRTTTFKDSKRNELYKEVMDHLRQSQKETQVKANLYRQAQGDASKMETAKAELAVLDNKQKSYLDSIQKIDPFLSKIIALNTYMSFANNQGSYANEVEYFTSEYFKFIDLKDPDYNRIPMIFESFKNFAQTLASIGMETPNLMQKISQHVSQIPAGSEAHRYALGGVVIALQSKNNPAYPVFARQFVNQFEATTDSVAIAGLKKQIRRSQGLKQGGEAPDFTQNTPEGNPMSLSDFRGKVVLIDFWASWCGPCRKENPHVVKLYNRFKDKGFEILGVSLDRDKGRWLKAIEKDQLTWNHVSDLRGWKNEVAQEYSVRSIPHTVLVDKEGKIIARNLRGAALENKLAQIFGE